MAVKHDLELRAIEDARTLTEEHRTEIRLRQAAEQAGLIATLNTAEQRRAAVEQSFWSRPAALVVASKRLQLQIDVCDALQCGMRS